MNPLLDDVRSTEVGQRYGIRSAERVMVPHPDYPKKMIEVVRVRLGRPSAAEVRDA